ncbi:MAG: hypothetical protein RMY64_29275 [Nostoc sp. DedQUE08]|uniref:hypothetical protein n=1 Tax=Nostoc sp. DedQUE08 TaxID=3075393 RepID=UPI002AD3DF37|nr:hypothetical protein [Nostoc sp. DedQUE08]MDZ8069653.1 hypothetical protein [Nostoc sp. DedQUE08]
MNQQPSKTDQNEVTQTANNAGGNVTQVGRDYQNTNYIFISFLLFGVLALGGLAWASTLGINNNGQNPQTDQQQQSSP